MKTFATLLALAAVVGVFLGPALAQAPKAGRAAGPGEDRMTRMTTMMGEMQEQMKQMQEQMKDMRGTGLMPDRMGGMTGMMEQMSTMMEQHRAEMQKLCPGAAAPQPPKTGG